MENTLKQILAELQDLNQKYNNLDKQANSLDKKVESHGELLHQLIKIVGTTNSHLEELSEGISNVRETQLEHEKILERLSLRSISQEADIAELRRIK
jgi:chromosome segregation ATPase